MLDERTIRGLKSYALEEMETAPPGMCGVSADTLYDMIERIIELDAFVSDLMAAHGPGTLASDELFTRGTALVRK